MFTDTILPENGQEFDAFMFDPETQMIMFKIKHEDFHSDEGKYECTFIENDE